MFRHPNTSSALTLLILLTGTCLPSLSAPSPVAPTPTVGSTQAADVPWMTAVGYRSSRGTARGQGMDDGAEVNKEEEEEDELFKDVDPKTLAAVLLEALNKPKMVRGMSGEKDEGGLDGGAEVQERGEDEENKEDGAETTTDDPKELEVRAAGEVNRDRDREQPELELVMAAAALQGREEREREEELEWKKAQDEEERLTEKVTSRTVSHEIPVKAAQQKPGSMGEEITGSKSQASGTASPSELEGEPRNDEEEEEQLNPEELKNLETMMKEFPSLGAASKRDDGDLHDADRESRGFNDILPQYKGKDLPMTKKKLKWQEETQKGMSFPTFRGGNFMDEFEELRSNTLGDDASRPVPLPDTNDMMEDAAEGGDDEEDDEEREDLSPEEEEARAKAEQEEVRRQAAEVQRAKIEEEKLADIASDMLLQYMVKQNGGKRKYREQNRKYSSLLNTAEDKRSNEVQEVEEEDDDIDPQTIDKLIEISSKLHLPADDVVDIINDVEKKKKKDVPSEIASLSPWLRPSSSLSSMSVPQMAINQNSYPSPKQPSQALNPLKTWFQEDPGTQLSLSNQDLWRKPLKPQPTNLDIFPLLQKSLSTNKGFIAKPQRTFWGSYPPYTAYQRPYQKTPYRGYYPVYFASPPKPKPRYYIPKAYPYTFNNPLGNSVRYDYNFPPKRHFHSWVQPRLRKPPASFQRSYYNNYLLPTYLRTFQRPTIANPRTPSQVTARLQPLPPWNRFNYPPAAAVVSRDKDYYDSRVGNQADDGNYDDVDFQQMLTQRLRKFQ
ncbi:unnamed protein product [Merluccius merluccius]